MRYFILAVTVLLTLTLNAYGQLTGPVGGITGGLVRSDPGIGAPLLTVPRIVAGPGSSTVDRDGNLYVFDVTYEALPMDRVIRVPASVKTRITIISSQGVVKSETVDGVYQLLGTGQHGVYASIVKYGAGLPAAILSVSRELVVFTGTTGQIATALPLNGEVRLYPSVDARPDMISIVEYAMVPMLTTEPTLLPLPARQRRAQLIRFNGVGGFQVSEPVPIP
jgi:hypothetical protein